MDLVISPDDWDTLGRIVAEYERLSASLLPQIKAAGTDLPDANVMGIVLAALISCHKHKDGRPLDESDILRALRRIFGTFMQVHPEICRLHDINQAKALGGRC